MVTRNTSGILFGMGAGVIWAVEAILGKLLFRSFTFIQVAASEALFGALTAFVYILARREPAKFKGENIINLLLVGFIGTVFAPLMYFFGLTQTLAIKATLIAHMQPLFVATLGFHFLGEKLHRRDFVSGVLIIIAAILITSGTVNNLVSLRIGNFGDLMVLFATFGWAVAAISGKKLIAEVSSIVIVGYRFLIASSVLVPLLFYLNQFAISSVYQALLGMLVGVGYIFYYEGLKRLKASQVALTELSSPFFAAVLAWHFLGETMTTIQIAGALLLISGLYILTQAET